MDTGRQITPTLERLLRARAGRCGRGLDRAITAVVIETALEALGHTAVIHRRDLLANGFPECEIYDMIAGYVLRARATCRRCS